MFLDTLWSEDQIGTELGCSESNFKKSGVKTDDWFPSQSLLKKKKKDNFHCPLAMEY